MAKKFSKKLPRNGKKNITPDQLVLEWLDNFSAQEAKATTEPEQPENDVVRMARETWAKIEAAFEKPTTPKEFSEEVLQIIGEYRVFLGEYEWSCKLPEKEPVKPLMPEPQLPALVSSSMGT